MNPQLIMAAILAAAGFVGGWTIQSWRYGAKENERAQQELVDERSAATTAIRRQESVIAATSAATAKETTLRRDADGSRRALVSLSDATDQTLRDASTSLEPALSEPLPLVNYSLQAQSNTATWQKKLTDMHLTLKPVTTPGPSK